MPACALLVVPNEILRNGLSCSLASSRRVTRVVEAESSAAALELAGRWRVDVALVATDVLDDLQTFLDRLERRAPGVRSIAIAHEDSAAALDRLLRSRAWALLGPSSSAAELWEALDAALARRAHVSSSLERSLLARLRKGADGPAALTQRERTILRMIGEGESNRRIAEILGVSRRTVETHRTRLMRKLDIHKTAGLVRYAVREGLVQL